MTPDELIDNFSLLDQWEDRYRYIIDLGKKLPSLDPEERTTENRVKGCISQVWLLHEQDKNRHYFRADSDAFIVKGLASILIHLFDGKTSQEIQTINVQSIFEEIGLSEHLSPTRRNGFFSMMQKIETLSQAT